MQQSLETSLWCCHSAAFCDTILESNVFMLTDLWCCGQYRTLSISCSYNSGTDFKRWMRVDWRHQGISPGSTLSPPQTTSWPALLCYSGDPTITKIFLVPWHFVIAGFHQNPANKLGLAGNEQLRQAGFQFDLLNAPNLLAALTPKNNSKQTAYLASYTG